MAKRNVLVEVNLTSNDMILGVRDQDHPLPTYIKYGVPVALSTDDQGVARSDMTHEWLRAVESYQFTYAEMKMFARQSLQHSFLPGASLWQGKQWRRVAACGADDLAKEKISAACQKFLKDSERAQTQWTLERAFAEFEEKF